MEAMFLERLLKALAWIPTKSRSAIFHPEKTITPVRSSSKSTAPTCAACCASPTFVPSEMTVASNFKLLKSHFFMQNQAKILPGAFQRIRQAQLTVYVDNLVKRTLNQPTQSSAIYLTQNTDLH